VACVVAVGVQAGLLVAPAAASDATIKATLSRGVSDIRNTHGDRKLDRQLARILDRLRADRGSTASGRTARATAVEGFTWMRRGLRARLDLIENDSGNLPASVRDARAADRRLKRGATLLRAAGSALGIRVGTLMGH
jgi:hypothetical protein